MSQQQNAPAVNWSKFIGEAMPQFERIAGAHQMVRWAEESQFAVQAIQGNDFMQKCAPETIQNAVINVAAVGLTLNPADGYAYLVPEYNKQAKRQECQLRISFKGLIKLATDTGSIKWVKAEVVREADHFTYKGPCEKPDHHMQPFQDRGKPVGVYCIAKTSEDDFLVDVMDWAEVEKIKACAKTQNVWNQWEEEMAKKAIIKRAQKQWPKTQRSQQLHEAVRVLNESEGSEDMTAKLQRTADYIIDAVAREDDAGIVEAWDELDHYEKQQIWIAKTKGGFFNQNQKEAIKAAKFAVFQQRQEQDAKEQPTEAEAES